MKQMSFTFFFENSSICTRMRLSPTKRVPVFVEETFSIRFAAVLVAATVELLVVEVVEVIGEEHPGDSEPPPDSAHFSHQQNLGERHWSASSTTRRRVMW